MIRVGGGVILGRITSRARCCKRARRMARRSKMRGHHLGTTTLEAVGASSAGAAAD